MRFPLATAGMLALLTSGCGGDELNGGGGNATPSPTPSATPTPSPSPDPVPAGYYGSLLAATAETRIPNLCNLYERATPSLDSPYRLTASATSLPLTFHPSDASFTVDTGSEVFDFPVANRILDAESATYRIVDPADVTIASELAFSPLTSQHSLAFSVSKSVSGVPVYSAFCITGSPTPIDKLPSSGWSTTDILVDGFYHRSNLEMSLVSVAGSFVFDPSRTGVDFTIPMVGKTLGSANSNPQSTSSSISTLSTVTHDGTELKGGFFLIDENRSQGSVQGNLFGPDGSEAALIFDGTYTSSSGTNIRVGGTILTARPK